MQPWMIPSICPYVVVPLNNLSTYLQRDFALTKRAASLDSNNHVMSSGKQQAERRYLTEVKFGWFKTSNPSGGYSSWIINLGDASKPSTPDETGGTYYDKQEDVFVRGTQSLAKEFSWWRHTVSVPVANGPSVHCIDQIVFINGIIQRSYPNLPLARGRSPGEAFRKAVFNISELFPEQQQRDENGNEGVSRSDILALIGKNENIRCRMGSTFPQTGLLRDRAHQAIEQVRAGRFNFEQTLISMARKLDRIQPGNKRQRLVESGELPIWCFAGIDLIREGSSARDVVFEAYRQFERTMDERILPDLDLMFLPDIDKENAPNAPPSTPLKVVLQDLDDSSEFSFIEDLLDEVPWDTAELVQSACYAGEMQAVFVVPKGFQVDYKTLVSASKN